MIQFSEIKNATERKKVKDLYLRAIPAHERAPFFWLWWKRKRKNVSFVNIYDEEKWVGFVFFSLYKDLVYVWFFAIDDSIRSKGYGSAVFSEIKRLYPNHRVVLGIEAPNSTAENAEQRVKRKQFYEKNGFRESGYSIQQKKDSFELLLIGETLHMEEIYSAFKEVDWLVGTLTAWTGKKKVKKKD